MTLKLGAACARVTSKRTVATDRSLIAPFEYAAQSFISPLNHGGAKTGIPASTSEAICAGSAPAAG